MADELLKSEVQSSNQSGPGSNEGKPTEDPEKKKTKLEADKLAIELPGYKNRLELEKKKLESELSDWRFRVAAAVITGIASVLAFFIGKAVERTSDTSKERNELVLQRDREENEDFKKNLASLGSADAGQREVAAAALRLYVSQPDRPLHSEDHVVESAIRGYEEQRIGEVLRAVSARMPSEADPVVLEEYSWLLVAIPDHALPYAVDVNKKAGSQLTRSAADYVAWSLPNPPQFQDLGCENDDTNPHNAENQKEIEQRYKLFKNLVARTPLPFEGTLYEGEQVLPAFELLFLLRTPTLKEFFQRECRYIVDLSSPMSGGQRVGEASKSYEDLLRNVRVMSVSSLTLNRILRSAKGQVKSDLSGTFMVNGTLNNLNLSQSAFKGSYLVGIASHFTCEDCDFSSADLSQFHFSAPCHIARAVFHGVSPDAMKGLNISSCDH